MLPFKRGRKEEAAAVVVVVGGGSRRQGRSVGRSVGCPEDAEEAKRTIDHLNVSQATIHQSRLGYSLNAARQGELGSWQTGRLAAGPATPAKETEQDHELTAAGTGKLALHQAANHSDVISGQTACLLCRHSAVWLSTPLPLESVRNTRTTHLHPIP